MGVNRGDEKGLKIGTEAQEAIHLLALGPGTPQQKGQVQPP